MESSCSKTNEAMHVIPRGLQEKHARDLGLANMDPKKLKRVLAIKEYSQKYRMKKIQNILNLETEVKALQAEVAINTPRLKYVDHQNGLLRMENLSLKQRLSVFSSELMLKETECGEIKKEIEVLKKLHVANNKLPEMFKAPTQEPSYNNNNSP